MTPYVKQKIPSGSLGIDRIRTPDRTEANKRDIEIVSKGWKLESFSSAANSLLEAATRLHKEVAAETKYWSEVLTIKEKGWKICRLPRERQTLGVQHGFLEGMHVSLGSWDLTLIAYNKQLPRCFEIADWLH